MQTNRPTQANACLNCNRTDREIPLITLAFGGENRYICAQCFPVLIHKPEQLADKLPGFVPPPAQPHEH